MERLVLRAAAMVRLTVALNASFARLLTTFSMPLADGDGAGADDNLYCLQANEAADRWEKKRLRVRIEERP